MNFCCYLLWLRRYERKSVEVGVFRRGWVSLNAGFRVKGASPTNHSWYESSRVIDLSCGIKIFAVRCLVLSQYTHLTDGQTDRQTDRQNYDSQDRPRICSRGKKRKSHVFLIFKNVKDVRIIFHGCLMFILPLHCCHNLTLPNVPTRCSAMAQNGSQSRIWDLNYSDH